MRRGRAGGAGGLATASRLLHPPQPARRTRQDVRCSTVKSTCKGGRRACITPSALPVPQTTCTACWRGSLAPSSRAPVCLLQCTHAHMLLYVLAFLLLLPPPPLPHTHTHCPSPTWEVALQWNLLQRPGAHRLERQRCRLGPGNGGDERHLKGHRGAVSQSGRAGQDRLRQACMAKGRGLFIVLCLL